MFKTFRSDQFTSIVSLFLKCSSGTAFQWLEAMLLVGCRPVCWSIERILEQEGVGSEPRFEAVNHNNSLLWYIHANNVAVLYERKHIVALSVHM